ncbi:amidohydrolase [Kiloniella spongiae]|uniref:Amidohydrolase n=1 Tax=Kiloniella spongiae TaxID=1489064 RepID=A0A0H2MDQ4_9PROT|nr:amidohydrolase [Kiloniella spongiae]KLN60346.1 amidohydrolase [Kiloniella spongiae]
MKSMQDFESSNCTLTAGKADLFLKNGRIYTVNSMQPWADCVAIRNGRFIGVGSFEKLCELITSNTHIIDLHGQFVMPGIYDMHTHPDLALAPSYAGYLDIGCEDPSPDNVKDAILNYSKKNTETPWVYGQSFVRYTFKKEGLVPDRYWLDSFISDRPVAIHDRSWGCMLVNSKALELAGITSKTKDPGNGYIERDPLSGEPTGILVDGAYSLIYHVMPPTPAPALERAYRDGLNYQASRGVVGTKYLHVCEYRLNALKAVDDEGQMTARVEAAISWQDDIFPVKRRWELLAGERHYYRSNRLNANAVKFHFDGTHESRSSYLSTSWPGESKWRGGLNLTPEHITDMVVDMDRKGIRVIAHCTGDGASDIFLDAVAEARRKNGNNDVRHQCAHSTNLLDENLPRFENLNVTAEFSPVGWYPSAFATARQNVGEERWPRMYNFKGVLDAGGIAVMGTDWPVSHINPWVGFEAMITRQNPITDSVENFPGQPVSLEEAIQVMTLNGACAMDLEDQAGSIVLGKSADFIVLENNPFEMDVRGSLHKMNVEMTFVEGQCAWDVLGRMDGTDNEAVWKERPNF